MVASAGPGTNKSEAILVSDTTTTTNSPGSVVGAQPATAPGGAQINSPEQAQNKSIDKLGNGAVTVDENGKVRIGGSKGGITVNPDGSVDIDANSLNLKSRSKALTFDAPEMTIANKGILTLQGRGIKIDGGEGNVDIVSGEGTVAIASKSMSLKAHNAMSIESDDLDILADGNFMTEVDGDYGVRANGRAGIASDEEMMLHASSDMFAISKLVNTVYGNGGVFVQSNKHMAVTAEADLKTQAKNVQTVAYGSLHLASAGGHTNIVSKTNLHMVSGQDSRISAQGMAIFESDKGGNILSKGSIRINTEGELGLLSFKTMNIQAQESDIKMYAGRHYRQRIKGDTIIRRDGTEYREHNDSVHTTIEGDERKILLGKYDLRATKDIHFQTGNDFNIRASQNIDLDAINAKINMQMLYAAEASIAEHKETGVRRQKLERRKQPSVQVPGKFPRLAFPFSPTSPKGSKENETPSKKHNKGSGVNTSNRSSSGMSAAGNNGVPCGGPSGGGTALGKDGSAGANKLGGLNQKLITAYNCAEQRFESETPFKVNAFAGVGSRGVSSSKHPSGDAVDVVIVGTDGVPVNNLRSSGNAWRIYEVFAYYMKECYDQNVGDGELGWGGWFSGGSMHNDTMHFEVTSRRDGRPSGARDWQTGEKGQGRELSCFGGQTKDCKDISGIPTQGAALNSGGSGTALGKDGSNGALTGGGCGVYGNEHSSDRWGNMPNTIGDKINRVKGVFGKINCGANGSGKAANKKQEKATSKEYSGSGQTPATGYVSPSQQYVGSGQTPGTGYVGTATTEVDDLIKDLTKLTNEPVKSVMDK